MADRRQTIADEIAEWGRWFLKRIPPVMICGFGVVLGVLFPLRAIFVFFFGWFFLMVLAKLIGSRPSSHTEPEAAAIDVEETTED